MLIKFIKINVLYMLLSNIVNFVKNKIKITYEIILVLLEIICANFYMNDL